MIKNRCGNTTKVMLSADIDCTAGFWGVSKAAMNNLIFNKTQERRRPRPIRPATAAGG